MRANLESRNESVTVVEEENKLKLRTRDNLNGLNNFADSFVDSTSLLETMSGSVGGISHAYLRPNIVKLKEATNKMGNIQQNSVINNCLTEETTSPNPLLNSLVLDNIFKFLPRKELLISRLVCSTWDTEACRLLRKELTLYFHDICHIRSFKKLMDRNLILKPNRDLPFARIYLRSTFRLGHEIAQEFFTTHGHHLRHIEISKVGCDCGANFFQKLIFFQAKYLTSLSIQIISGPIGLSPNSTFTNSRYSRIKKQPLNSKWKLPHLKHLNLRHQLFIERPRFIDDLLEACVNLESLTTDDTSPAFCQNMIIPRILATKRHRWNKLKKIMTGDTLYLNNDQFLLFAERKFRLEQLSLGLNCNFPRNTETNVKNLLAMLTSYSDTLKKVTLCNVQPGTFFELLSFPHMPKLVQLKLSNIVFSTQHLEGLPSLKEYYIVDEFPRIIFYGYDHDFTLSPHKSLHSMTFYPICPSTRLNLGSLTKWFSFTKERANLFISDIAKAFPCLRILTISGNDYILHNIYEKMPSLEQLTIYGPVSDEGITGVPLELCKKMHSEQDYALVELEELNQLKFIGNLKKLKKLMIPPLPFSRCLLTEVSVFLGFACCTDMIELEIDNKELFSLWKDEMNRIRGTPMTS